jgi:hypothetical protein
MSKELFEDFLKEGYAKDYKGTDDDMPDAFDEWVSDLEGEELIAYGNQALSMALGVTRSDMGEGLSAKDFNAILDEYLTTKKIKNGGDFWEDLSDLQKTVINEIKKSFKRQEHE